MTLNQDLGACVYGPCLCFATTPSQRRRRQDVVFYAFDLLWHDNEDLRQLPLVERKRRLRRLVRGRARLLFAEQIQGSGVELFQAICARDLEGIVAKHRLGPYDATPVTWFKVLNPDYTQKRGRREMFDKFRDQRDPAVPRLTPETPR